MSDKVVYVIGAGFSAPLGFPTINDLLVRLWDRLKPNEKGKLEEVIAFHHPGFSTSRTTSFPNVESLLSDITVNAELFEASRTFTGGFTKAELETRRRTLLQGVEGWFHEILDALKEEESKWLMEFGEKVRNERATIISFNWDLVLDRLLFGQNLARSSYGFGPNPVDGVVLLKPHGSLNWYADDGKFIKEERRFLLHGKGEASVYGFRRFRAPSSRRRKYEPLIVPPMHLKNFDRAIFRTVWKRCVKELSAANEVRFLGYSLPDADYQARFILRCGFYNQTDGQILKGQRRSEPVGAARVQIVNPDKYAALRTEAVVGHSAECKWLPTTVENWLLEDRHLS